MTIVCGVDCSTLTRPNWVAWLEDRTFTLDAYVPSRGAPLPALTVKPGRVACVAFDAPQGLPLPGEAVREADRLARTPTRRLPSNRRELDMWRPCRGLIEAGISIFWWCYETSRAAIPGLPEGSANTTIVETYPRHIIRRLWPDMRIPSKRNDTLAYVDAVYSGIQKLGYLCRSVIRPTTDQVDAMLCALAARAFVNANGLPDGTVGSAPVVDDTGTVLREGFIVSP